MHSNSLSILNISRCSVLNHLINLLRKSNVGSETEWQ